MAGLSRVPTQGTVFTRIENLMRAGVIKGRDRPIWYDVIEKFPPKDEDSLPGIDHGALVKEILYPEDQLRVKFYKTYGTQRATNMVRHSTLYKTPCGRFITKYQELEKGWTKSEDELFKTTVQKLAMEGLALKVKGDRQTSKQLSSKEVVLQTLASMFEKSTSAANADTGGEDKR